MEEFDLFGDSSEDDQNALRTARTLASSEQHLGTMLELMPIGVLVHSQQSIIFSNQQASTYLGAPANQVRGQHFLDFVAQTDLKRVQNCFAAAFATEGTVQEIECALERGDGTSRLMKVIAAHLPWQGTPVIQLLMQDITDQKRAETSLRQMTITDELTGAYNRRHAMYEAHLYLDTAQSENLPFSVVSVDIDHFKSVNDTHGHDAGDLVLRGLAEHAAEFLATRTELDSAIFARMGGEEFLLLLPGTGLKDAVRCADQFRKAIAALSFEVAGTLLKITVSAGAACYRSDDGSIERLLKRADTALYSAKATGRNRVVAAE